MNTYPVLNFKNTLYSKQLNEEIYNLQSETFTIPDSYNYNVLEVNDEYIARPDLIALDAYGDTIFTDVICKLNGISNPFELNKGMKLILPSPEYINSFTHIVYDDDIDNEDNIIKPEPKYKQSKRKANEAVVGDKRFKIDQSAGIIIY